MGRAWFAGQPGSVPFIYQRGQFARIEVVGAEGLVPAGVWDINDLGWISGGTTGADGRSLGYIARPIR